MGEDNYALLDGNWDSTPVSAQKQKMLAKLEFKLASGPAVPPPQTAACHVSYSVVNSWNTGFQAAIAITNTGTTNVSVRMRLFKKIDPAATSPMPQMQVHQKLVFSHAREASLQDTSRKAPR